MKSKIKNKVIAFAMSLAMAFTMMPIMGAPVYADDPAPAAPGIALGSDVLSVGSNTSGAATVHMADKAWRVIGYGVSQEGGITQVASSADTMTLIAGDNLKTGVQFNPSNNPVNTYKESTLHGEVNALTDENNGIFSKEEKAGIVSRDLQPGEYSGTRPYTNGIAGDEVEGALLWPLSTQEAFYMDSELRKASSYWWLRSPGVYAHIAANVGGVGDVDIYGITVDGGYGVRPAFNFNLKSVIFTSAAAGSKSSEGVGAGALKPVGSNSTNDWKLTVQSGHEGFKITSSSYDNTNHVLTVYYSGAVTSPDGNEYVSAVVVDKDGKITHYGNIKQCKSDGDASGQIEINLDGVLSCGNDTEVYVFNEQLNGDKKTDYASKQIEITVPATAEHNYLWESMNDENHKGVCNVCGEETMERHTYAYGICAVCNGSCTHSSLSDSYAHNSEWHWKECEYCLLKFDEENHAWQDEWTADGTKHWHECEVCQRKKDEAAHSGGTATCTEKAKCEVCNGEYGDLGEHKYSAWKNLDATQHQRVCERDKTHIEKANHSWDAGKVTKAATEKQAGTKTFTCTVCKATKTETIPKLKPSSPKVSGTPLAKMTAKSKSITISWNKIQGAAGYDIFFARCNHSNKKIVTKKVKTIKGNKTFKWTKSGLKKGTAYKAYVRAYVYKNGKKTYVKNSPLMHAYTGNGTKNYTNAKSVTVNKTKVTLKKGKTSKIKAKVNKVNKKKKLMPKSHAPTLRYMTSNSKIASVNSGGKITAKGSGTCYIYVYAHNGVSKKVKVTVK